MTGQKLNTFNAHFCQEIFAATFLFSLVPNGRTEGLQSQRFDEATPMPRLLLPCHPAKVSARSGKSRSSRSSPCEFWLKISELYENLNLIADDNLNLSGDDGGKLSGEDQTQRSHQPRVVPQRRRKHRRRR